MIRVSLLPGDGIGPEVAEAMKKCVEATGVSIEWDTQIVGEPAIEKYGTPLPDHVIDSIKKNKVAIKGPIVTPVGRGFRSVNVHLRHALDLFACVRPSKYYEGTKAKTRNIDLVVIRENTEDLYAGVEFEVNSDAAVKVIDLCNQLQCRKIKNDSAISIKPISISGSQRVIEFAFDYALKNNRKKVAVVHKANIMKYTDGLFLEMGRMAAKKYEGRVEFQDVIVDNMCMQLVQRPEHYDVLVLPNLYGDIISDLCAGLIGGLGIAPGANIGKEMALFEPVHGSAPKYAGKNKVNPTATILSGVLMLRYLNESRAADRLEQAVADVLKEGKDVTYDLKADRNDPTAVGTQEMAQAICKRVKALP